MRIAVARATGNIGSLTVDALARGGHEAIGLSRSLGVDLATGAGLDAILTRVEAVVDATNYLAGSAEEAVALFGTATGNLLAAGQVAGVRHHVLLSKAALGRVEGNAHYAGKREQERLVASGRLPWTIVPATQFHDFAATVIGWTERDGVAPIRHCSCSRSRPADVAAVLPEIAVGVPQGRYRDVAGPETQDLVDLARRTNDARGRRVKLVPTWSSLFGPDWAGEVLLPGADARITPTTFDEWLAQQR